MGCTTTPSCLLRGVGGVGSVGFRVTYGQCSLTLSGQYYLGRCKGLVVGSRVCFVQYCMIVVGR